MLRDLGGAGGLAQRLARLGDAPAGRGGAEHDALRARDLVAGGDHALRRGGVGHQHDAPQPVAARVEEPVLVAPAHARDEPRGGRLPVGRAGGRVAVQEEVRAGEVAARGRGAHDRGVGRAAGERVEELLHRGRAR